MEHIKRSHPFGVTFCQIVIHCYYMYTVACQCIEEYRQGSHQSFTFTCCHFGDFSFMKYYTTKKLYIIMDHIPYRIIPTGIPVILIDRFVTFDAYEVFSCSQCTVKICGSYHNFFVFGETSGCVFYDRESYREYFFQCFFVYFEYLFFEFINLSKYLFAIFQFY